MFKLKVRRNGSCKDQVNKKMKKLERNTDISMSDMSGITLLHSQTGVQLLHTELGSVRKAEIIK